MNALLAGLLLTGLVGDPPPSRSLGDVLERVTVHPSWAEVVRRRVQTVGRDEVSREGRGFFVVALCEVEPDVDAESIRVVSRSPSTSVESWSVKDAPARAGWSSDRYLEMVAGLVVGDNPVEISAVTRAARWRPEHRARFDETTGELTLSTVAVVQQSTGETWDALVAIDAGPSESLAPPGTPPPPSVHARIAGDGSEHRLALPDQAWPARVELALRPSRHVTAEATLVTTSPATRPIAAGAVSMLAGDRYLGVAQLHDVPAGEALRLPFGAEPRLRASRQETPPSREGRATVVRVLVESGFDAPVELDVEEPLPPGTEVVPVTTPGWTLRGDVVSWRLRLEPRERREIVLRLRASRTADPVRPSEE